MKNFYKELYVYSSENNQDLVLGSEVFKFFENSNESAIINIVMKPVGNLKKHCNVVDTNYYKLEDVFKMLTTFTAWEYKCTYWVTKDEYNNSHKVLCFIKEEN